MSYMYLNTNPLGKTRGDCVIRAISTAENESWDTIFLGIVAKAYELKDIPSSNLVWQEYLFDIGYNRYSVISGKPHCYTVRDFCIDNPLGIYILGTGSHVICVINGNYYDTWDSGEEQPLYFWAKEGER